MKTFILSVITLFLLSHSYAQSFEKMNFPDITTTLSSSRSANFIDVNGDGWDDIFFTNGLSTGEKNMLYLNNGNGSFITVTDDDIVEHSIRAVGASFADVDNDNDLDGFVVTWGSGGQPKRNYFYRNNGNSTFTFDPNVAPNLTYSETATLIDVNNDQLLDLYITNSAQSLRNLYFENQGDGSFIQRTDLIITNENIPSRSVDWVDYDNDGDSDLFVTNEGNNKNTLYRNDGPNNFTQITDLAIVQDLKNSMGSSWADVDNDGDFDLLVTNYEHSNQLFINENGIFTEDLDSEISAEITNSFGSTFGDFDNDGDLDLFIANSYSDTHFTNSIFINDGNGNFTKNTSSILANHEGWTYSAAFGDYNNDGWLDVILANNENESQENAVFKNTGTGNNWIKIKCIGTNSNKSAIGTIVKITAVINGNSVTQMRKVEASSGYASQNSLTTHFGLGNAAEIQEIQIKWPSGLVENFSGLDINNIYNLTEGNGTMALSEINKSEFKVYPNPSKDTLFIDGKFDSNSKFELINSEGKQIQIFDLELNNKTKINISNLSNGIYFYKISEDGKVIDSGKIIKN
ncbi:CRTAC1 family protein [Moheibacter sediminis]|uniref:Por secretion system C-terminal sorting domain-containing protein n=1 Tax=Moheibacter sediminis TaxID=1434700 RepID=A0A1W1YYS3_9FLAO|nr:CRTAC1 family protein [Moheibacter sediminis]SMC41232.1 Por secretion system C-terminal sorting domain-containing protein [Moheibacter sediminis]